MSTPSPKFSRPKPSATWAFDWYDGPIGSALHHRTVTVRASHGNPPSKGREASTDDVDSNLPNRIEITDGTVRPTTIILDRSAAEDLAETLLAALGWDGR
jgi:hypothetical protein